MEGADIAEESLGGPSRMQAKHLREWLRNHLAEEALAEVERLAVIEER